MAKVRCLMAHVYTARKWDEEGYDPSNGGITSRYDTVFVKCPDGPFERDDGDEDVLEVVPNSFGTCKAVAPNQENGDRKQGPMFGGNYVGSSDSRFGRLVEEVTGQRFCRIVPVHDRYETAEQHAALGR